MKRTALTFIIILCSLIPLSAQRGEKSAGIRAGYNSCTESAVAGIYFQYRFSEHIRIAPDIDYVFKHNNVDAFAFDCNMHFPFALGTSGINLYPIGGISYSCWNIRHISPDLNNTDDVTTRSNKFGLNAGGGLEWYATPTLKVSAEGKYRWIDDFDSGVFSLSIGYIF